jgi:hypothetical protein
LPVILALPGNDPDKEGLFLFMHAARWPDDIRGDEDLHCGNCHFVNFRFVPGQPSAAPVSVGGELLEAFAENVQVIQSNVSNDEKAMAAVNNRATQLVVVRIFSIRACRPRSFP